jgi:SAM-dependent methyltransferase
MTVDALKELLPQLDLTRSADWHAGLEARKREERDFHNSSKESRESEELAEDAYEQLHGNKKYYSVVGSSRVYLREWLARNVPGRVFLDYACGNGDQAIGAAKLGASLAIGIDISDVSVANARKQAAAEGVSDRCVFLVADCEATGFPDECVDVILCSGMLHHLDLQFAFPEMRRILKPGGRVFAVESLDYNPAIKAYRLLTPVMRTEWEKHHILGLGDLRLARKFFEVRDVRYWHLFSLWAMAFRKSPALFEKALRSLDWVDSIAMSIPGLQLMAWQFTFELVKPARGADRG